MEPASGTKQVLTCVVGTEPINNTKILMKPGVHNKRDYLFKRLLCTPDEINLKWKIFTINNFENNNHVYT